MSWVLFDYGGVIAGFPPAADLVALAAVAGTDVPVLLEEYWQRRLAYDLAELDARQYWREVGAGLGRDYSDSVIAQLVRLDVESWMHLTAGTVSLVEELAAAGHRLALLSNAPAEIAEAIGGLPIAGHFEQLLFSCQLRLAKPDPHCFRVAIDRLGASAGEVVFVDDRPDNVAAAASLGLRAVHFTGPWQARGAVAALLTAPATGPG